jgi:hypothetical protein
MSPLVDNDRFLSDNYLFITRDCLQISLRRYIISEVRRVSLKYSQDQALLVTHVLSPGQQPSVSHYILFTGVYSSREAMPRAGTEI